MDKDLLDKYNNESSLLVITPYPRKGEIYSQGVCAVASFAKNTLLSLKKINPKKNIVVLTLELGEREIYEEDDMLIIRCFRRNNTLSYFALLKYIYKLNKPKEILLEFEFGSYGNTAMTSLLIPLIWILFLMGKKINIVAHQVVSDIRGLSGHLGLPKKGLTIMFLNLSFKIFYFLLMLPAQRVIVLEEEFKRKLSRFTSKNKIFVIPHGVDTRLTNGVSKSITRKSLGIEEDDFVILCFGFINWYKGTDFLVNSIKKIDSINGKRVKLLLAGGPSFTQGQKSHYKKFYDTVSNSIKGYPNIIATGFLEEDKITPVFEASDLVILPYRTFMSSSGPLSLAISHKKPFIISNNLSPITNSLDIKKAMELSSVDKNYLIFSMNAEDLIRSIAKTMDPSFMERLKALSRILNKERSFFNVALSYDLLLNSKIETKPSLISNLFSLNRG